MKPVYSLVALALLVGCGEHAAPEAKSEPAALTQVVGMVAADADSSYSGEIRARHEAQLGFRIPGKLVERLVDAGARVSAGQVLARLDAADAALQANSADTQLRLAAAEVQRYRELHNKGFISQSALDIKEAAFNVASAQAGLARNQAGYATLRADHAGIVAAVLAEPGQVLSVGQPVLRIAQDGEREVAIALPEAQLGNVKIGSAATVEVLNNAGLRLNGRLRELAPAADPVSRTFAARISLAQAPSELALGMTARVSFSIARQQAALLIPLTAIFQQGDQAAVWIVAADHSISLRPIQVAAYRDTGALIASGLVAGERIVSNGVHRLSPGQKIRIIESVATSSMP
ncbi:MAG: efflux RND transporter periplasmic adaptor subunit [Nitrosomonadales bacterium]|nr:efflux RND transporter periplasmic adaptor subunit [Nitrosomonadales bacterium]